jgi:hypothetical protein
MAEPHFETAYEFQVSPRRTVHRDEIIKVKGESGDFRFLRYVKNTRTGAEWFDALELERGVGYKHRSFRLERLVPKPVKRNVRR